MEQHEQGSQPNEKNELLAKEGQHDAPVRTQRKRQYVLKAVIITLVLFVWWSATAIESLLNRTPREFGREDTNKNFMNFQDIIPSEKLEWHWCYHQFMCARLTVPMDYHRPLTASKDNPKVHVALVLFPGKHANPGSYSISPLLINPGGPGGSGVQFAIGAGTYLQTIVGEDQDIIGFDPRGIGATTPRADCFSFPGETDGIEDHIEGQFHRMLWQTSGREIGLANSSEVALHKIDVRARGLGQLCGEKDSLYGNDSILRYVSTPNVARDMISVIDAWDEWRAAQSEDSVLTHEPSEIENKASEQSYDLNTGSKLVYWGFSYGTLLGATFAAMFPDRVGRVVLDGVVDADYYVSPVWAASLHNADAISESFYTYCHAAGKKCDLYRQNDTPADIKTRFVGTLARIRKDPIVLMNEWTKMPQIIYESDIRSILFSTLYSPTLVFPMIATIFDQLENGHDDILKQILAVIPPGADLPFLCGPPAPAENFPTEATFAIMCSDKRYPLNATISEIETIFQTMANTSSWADVWISLMVGCDGWPIESRDPPMRWDDHPAHNPKPIKTSFPVLFVSNTADPVTPLYAGVKMAQKFVDAGLIEQKSEGHCSLAAVSLCTTRKLIAYFRDGEVPPPPVKSDKGLRAGKWDKCDAESWPWHQPGEEASIAENGEEGLAEVKIMQAVNAMQRELVKQLKPWKNTGVLSMEKLMEIEIQPYQEH